MDGISGHAGEHSEPTALLLGTATTVGDIGTFRWDLASDRLQLSERAQVLLGMDNDRTPTAEQVIEQVVHADERERAYDQRERSRSTADMVPAGDWLLTGDDSHARWVSMTMAPAFEGVRAVEMVGSLLDVTERHDWPAERRIYHAAFTALRSDAPPANATALLESVVRALDWEAATLWLEQADGPATRGAHWSRSGHPAPSPSNGLRRAEVLTVPVLTGDRKVASLELDPGEGQPLRPQLGEAVHAVAGQLGDFLARRGGPATARSPLTARETEVLQLASHGGSSALVADQLVISTSTVKTHFEHIYTKLGVIDRAGAVAEALRRQLID